MMNLLVFIGALLLLLLSAFFFVLGYKVLRADPNKYERNRKATRSLIDNFQGRVDQWIDADRRNPIVSCGVAVKNGKLSPRGKLSDEAIREIIL